jgi:hypothetical protein
MIYGFRTAMAKGNLNMAYRCGFTQSVLAQTLHAVGFSSVACKRRFIIQSFSKKSDLSF